MDVSYAAGTRGAGEALAAAEILSLIRQQRLAA